MNPAKKQGVQRQVETVVSDVVARITMLPSCATRRMNLLLAVVVFVLRVEDRR